MSAAFAIGPISGCCLNPALAVGVMGSPADLVGLVGEVAAAAPKALAQTLLRRTSGVGASSGGGAPQDGLIRSLFASCAGREHCRRG